MARHKGAPFYVRSVDGWAVLEYRTTDGQKKVRLGFRFDPKSASPAERRAAQEAAEARWRDLTSERVIVEHARVKTSRTLGELYTEYEGRWVPDPTADLNSKKKLSETLIVRRAYGMTLRAWASDESQRSDKSKRWRGDTRTPLERVCSDNGPTDFLAWRLTQVVRKTMRKEKSNLVQFLEWCKAQGYLASLPPVNLPTGTGTRAIKNSGRGVKIPLTALEARQLIAVMPEWSRSEIESRRFLVRSFFEFMWLTGLRPATLKRMEIGRNWLKGATVLRLTAEDDKAKYGREFPLTKMAVEVLNRIAPSEGHIWGHHDRRQYVEDAAAVVFKNDPHRRQLFGSYHLRHFVGTFLANRAGTNLPAAQFVMGHTDLSTTSAYVNPDQDAARALLTAVEPELRKAQRAAEKWAAKQKS